MRMIFGLVALILTGVLQVVMVANPAPSDWFFMSTGTAIFTLAVSLHLCSAPARKLLLVNAFVMMILVGMRFDAPPSLIVAGVIFAMTVIAAATSEVKNGQLARS